jgi:hypothetical protein
VAFRRLKQAAWQVPHPVDHAFSVKRRAVNTIEYQMPVKGRADAKGPNALELGMAKVPGSAQVTWVTPLLELQDSLQRVPDGFEVIGREAAQAADARFHRVAWKSSESKAVKAVSSGSSW